MSRLYHFFFALVFLFSLPAYSNNYANLTLKKALEIAKSNNYKIIYLAFPLMKKRIAKYYFLDPYHLHYLRKLHQ